MTIHEAVARNLGAHRRRRGITQSELALRAEMSISMACCIERGVRLPSLESFLRLCWALGVEPNDLLDGVRQVDR